MRVLVVGATGAVGSRILSQLLALSPALSSPLAIRVSTRDPSKASFPAGVEVVQADMGDASSYPRLFDGGVDRCFIYTQGADAVAAVAQAAKAASVQRLVLLSSFTVQHLADTMIGQRHKAAEEAVLGAGVPYTFLRAGWFSRNSASQWMTEARQSGTISLPFLDVACAPVAEDDIAAVAVVALTTDKLLNAAPVITGPQTLRLREVVEHISQLRQRNGAAAVEARQVSIEEWKAANARMPPPFHHSLITMWQQWQKLPEQQQPSEQHTGKPSVSFEQFVEREKELYVH